MFHNYVQLLEAMIFYGHIKCGYISGHTPFVQMSFSTNIRSLRQNDPRLAPTNEGLQPRLPESCDIEEGDFLRWFRCKLHTTSITNQKQGALRILKIPLYFETVLYLGPPKPQPPNSL